MRLAIMQPYFFPYIGYFQLINAVDKFVFYDDVNFIKKGWINRNRILINGQANYFTVHLNGASQNRLINEIKFIDNRKKLITSIQMAYKRAPYFQEIYPLIKNVLSFQTKNISQLAIYSIKTICEYLGIKTIFEISSLNYTATKGLERTERLKKICKINNASDYINPIGGMKLYRKEDFEFSNIHLSFLKPNLMEYKQFQNNFISGLSIIDVLMFNPLENLLLQLDNYELI